MVQGVVKQFEKPRGAAPLAVSANSGLQRGLRAEDADGLPDGGPLPFDDALEEAYSRDETGARKKTSPENASRAIIIKIILGE